MANMSNVSPDTVVLVNLSGAGGPNGRITVNETLTLRDLGVDPDNIGSVDPPVFPEYEIRSIASSITLTPKEKTDKISQIVSAYNKVAESFSKLNLSIEDSIINAVTNWLVREKGFSRDDVPDAPVINDNELQVTTVDLNDGVLFSVNGTAVWG